MKKKIFMAFAFLSSLFIGYSQKGNAPIVYKTNNDIIYNICFTEKGGVLGIADDNTIKAYSTNSQGLLYEFKNGHKSQILAIDISKDSTLLVSGGKDSTMVIWDFVNKKILKSLTYQKGIITSVKISPDRRYLASGGTDNKVYLYDLEKNEVVHEFTDHVDDITSVKFSPDGTLLATASGDNTIKIYDVKNIKLLASLTGHKSWVRDISFSGDGTRLISCGDDSRIIEWNITNIQNIRVLNNSKIAFCWILSVAFNNDSKSYAYGDFNGNTIIDTPFSRYKINFNVPINKVIFKPNENDVLEIAIATRGKGVFLINAKDMKLKER
jgi:WD40 repeat protein